MKIMRPGNLHFCPSNNSLFTKHPNPNRRRRISFSQPRPFDADLESFFSSPIQKQTSISLYFDSFDLELSVVRFVTTVRPRALSSPIRHHSLTSSSLFSSFDLSLSFNQTHYPSLPFPSRCNALLVVMRSNLSHRRGMYTGRLCFTILVSSSNVETSFLCIFLQIFKASDLAVIILFFFFGLKEALGFAPSWHLCLRYSSFLVKLSLLHSISKLSLLHSISKLSSPNPSLPFLVEVLASSVSQEGEAEGADGDEEEGEEGGDDDDDDDDDGGGGGHIVYEPIGKSDGSFA
ncbi:hypothetical protein Bca4012_076862 [Brassica carinata]